MSCNLYNLWISCFSNHNYIPLRRNVSARTSLCGLRRLICVDTLRRGHNLGFSRDCSYCLASQWVKFIANYMNIQIKTRNSETYSIQYGLTLNWWHRLLTIGSSSQMVVKKGMTVNPYHYKQKREGCVGFNAVIQNKI